MKKIFRMVKHLLPHRDITLIILKGHLVIEELLFDQAASVMRDVSELKRSRLSFNKLVHLTKALFVYSNDRRLWQAIEKLNLLRNELVHHLEDTKLQTLAEAFLRPCEDMMRRIGPTPESLDSRLRSALAFVYGALLNLSNMGRSNEAGKAGHRQPSR
jgi:hypothetical protein